MADEIIDNGGTTTATTQGIASTVHPQGVPPAAPVQEQVPAAPAAPAPVVEEAKPAPAAPVVDPSKPLSVDAPAIVPVAFEPSGNPTLDIINEYIGNCGIGPDSAEYKAALEGNFEPLEAKFKSLGDKAKGYERIVGAAKQEYSNAKSAHDAKHGATISMCHDMAKEVGGWDELSNWVREHADAKELAEINEALAAGGLAAQKVTRWLVDLRKANPDATKATPRSPVKENASAIRDASGGALSQHEFQKEIGRLMDKHGTNYVHTPEYRDAQRRRAAYRG